MPGSRDACVVGLGYVGLPLAVALTDAGLHVVGLDASPARVAQLQAGDPGIEDISTEQLANAMATSTLVVTDDPQQARAGVYVICVPTPLRDSMPDLEFVRSAAATVATLVQPGDLVILESTTYPGTTEEVVLPILATSGLAIGTDVLLAYSPERIDPANPEFTVVNTPKVVGGINEESGEAAERFYRKVVSQVVRVSGTREAEMAKLLENTFRQVNIALVNEMAVFCREMRIDLWESIRAASSKPFGYMPFFPGPGVGGHCIPVDPSYLSWRVKAQGYEFRFVELAQEINRRMPQYVVTRLGDLLNDAGVAYSRSTVLCIGAAYKAGVGDCRESPAIQVMKQLRAKGVTVRYHDPYVPELTLDGELLTSVPLSDDELSGVDAVLVLTAHPGLDWRRVAATSPYVLDTRGVVPQDSGRSVVWL